MVKYRNPVFVILFTIITIGVYGVYWLFSTTKELHELKAKDAPNTMLIIWMIVLVILGALTPPVGIIFSLAGVIVAMFFYWKYSKSIEQISKGKYSFVLLFVFFLFFSPVSIVLAQLALNKRAKKRK